MCTVHLIFFLNQEILKDRSENKRGSHSRLVGFIHRHQGTTPLSKVYLKSQLIALCQAYGVRTSSRSTKLGIVQDLLNVIPDHAFIPKTILVDDRRFRILESSEFDEHIRIHFQRGKLCIWVETWWYNLCLYKKLSNYSHYLNSKQFCNTAQYSAVQKLKNFVF